MVHRTVPEPYILFSDSIAFCVVYFCFLLFHRVIHLFAFTYLYIDCLFVVHLPRPSPLALHRCPSCGTFISTTSMLPGRPSLNCFVCGVDLPPGTPYTRKIACTSDKQVGASSRPTTDCFHTDGESRRPFLIDDDTKGAKCDDCQNTAIFDLSGQGVEEFSSCQECFFIPRADVVRAGATFIQQSNLRVRSITAYRSPSSGGGSPQGVRSLLSATPHPRTSSTSSPKGAGAANAAGNVSVPSSFAKAPGSSRAGKGKRPRVE